MKFWLCFSPCVALVLCVAQTVSAQTPDNWQTTSGNWNNSSNWSAGVPTSNSAVTLTGGGTITLDNTGASGSAYSIDSGSDSTVPNTLFQVTSQSLSVTTSISAGFQMTLTDASVSATDFFTSNKLTLTDATSVLTASSIHASNSFSNSGSVVVGNLDSVSMGAISNSGAMTIGNGNGGNVTGTTLMNTNSVTLATTSTTPGSIGASFTLTGTLTNGVSGQTSGGFSVGNLATVTAGDITNYSTFSIGDATNGNGGSVTGSSFTNNGSLNINTGASLSLGTGDFSNSNSGSVNIGNSATVTAGAISNANVMTIGDGDGGSMSGSSFLNNGSVTVSDITGTHGAALTITGSFTNNSLVYVGNMATASANSISNNAFFQVGGGNGGLTTTPTFTNNASATLYLSSSSGTGMPGGELDATTFVSGGGATADSGSLMRVGSTAPSGTTGYYQSADGTLEEMIFGSSNEGSISACDGVLYCGIIGVTSDAVQLSGIVDPTLENGYDPSNGTGFEILTFTPGELSGEFLAIENQIFNNGTQQWVVDYDNTDGYVALIAEPTTTSPTPEPASLLLIGSGVLTLGFARTRRKR